MSVVRGRDRYGIDLFVHLVKHHAKVIEEWLRGLPVLHVFCAMIAIHITKRDKVFLAAALLVGLLCDPTARADESDVELTVRGNPALPIANVGKTELPAKAPAAVVKKLLRFKSLIHQRSNELVKLLVASNDFMAGTSR